MPKDSNGLLVPLVGLLGVLFGAGISSWAQLRGASLLADKERDVQAAVASREMYVQMTNCATDYLAKLTRHLTIEKIATNQLMREKMRNELVEASYRIALMSSLSTSEKILEGTLCAGRLMDARVAGNASDGLRTKCMTNVAEVFGALTLEVSAYRLKSSPRPSDSPVALNGILSILASLDRPEAGGEGLKQPPPK